jgi:hypothetical protein
MANQSEISKKAGQLTGFFIGAKYLMQRSSLDQA